MNKGRLYLTVFGIISTFVITGFVLYTNRVISSQASSGVQQKSINDFVQVKKSVVRINNISYILKNPALCASGQPNEKCSCPDRDIIVILCKKNEVYDQNKVSVKASDVPNWNSPLFVKLSNTAYNALKANPQCNSFCFGK
ncbi:MAG: hypothetical protein WCO06_03585 [Candidatus Roizmanbacteria bacterium]